VLRGGENAPALPPDASRKELEAGTQVGRVVEVRGAEVVLEPLGLGEPVAARLRRSTRVPHGSASPIVVGDEVRFLAEGPSPPVVTEVLPRRTHLTRVRRGREDHVLCANVDLGVVVSSVALPPFKPGLVDRMLVSFAEGGIAPLLALNKADLLPPEEVERLVGPYRDLGVAAVAVSAKTGEGLDDLARHLAGHVAVLSGQSGVGKSSLLNELAGLDLRTAHVYGRLGKGRHTTSTSTLYRLPSGGAVIDTPGVRSYALHRPTRAALRAFFPEIFEVAESCRFADCRHRGDEGCALPAAVEAGRIRPERFASFLGLAEETQGD
jgi:ribosome biogenesis GTPase